MSADDDELAMLLPFYVNRTLGPADAARVEVALARSSELRAELSIIHDLAQKLKAGGREVTIQQEPDDHRLAAVLGRIDDKPAAVVAAPPARPGLGKLLAFLNPQRWHPAVALSLMLAVGGQTVFIGNLAATKRSNSQEIASLNKQVGDLQYALASGPEGVHPGNVVVQLRPDAGWAAVAALLGKEGLTIVGGPSDGTLTLSSDAKGAALQALITRLRASPLVTAADKAA